LIKVEARGKIMKRISTLFEITLSATLTLLGLYMLQEGTSNKATSAAAILIAGAVCFTVGVMTFTSAVRSILWHRSMLRHSRHHNYMGDAAPGHDRG
jgi:uncharacterized membrane protein YgdD (TMEM256/DUF423 family)